MSRPAASSPQALDRMRRQQRRDTRPELALRHELFRRGLRYRVHRRPLPDFRRTLDIVFGPGKVAVDVRGCFWHMCPEHGSTPRANREWWMQKLAANVRRDEETERRLREAGWLLVVVWEHEDPGLAASRVERAVRMRRQALRRTPGRG